MLEILFGRYRDQVVVNDFSILMNEIAQMKENVDLQRCYLRHHLCGMQKFLCEASFGRRRGEPEKQTRTNRNNIRQSDRYGIDNNWIDRRDGREADTFGNFLKFVAIGGIEIYALDELHIVEERIERHKVREGNFSTVLSGADDLPTIKVAISIALGGPCRHQHHRARPLLTPIRLSLTFFVSR